MNVFKWFLEESGLLFPCVAWVKMLFSSLPWQWPLSMWNFFLFAPLSCSPYSLLSVLRESKKLALNPFKMCLSLKLLQEELHYKYDYSCKKQSLRPEGQVIPHSCQMVSSSKCILRDITSNPRIHIFKLHLHLPPLLPPPHDKLLAGSEFLCPLRLAVSVSPWSVYCGIGACPQQCPCNFCTAGNPFHDLNHPASVKCCFLTEADDLYLHPRMPNEVLNVILNLLSASHNLYC